MSNYKVPPFIKRDGDALLFSEPDKELLFYVPEVYFERSNAIIVGEYVNILGIMDYTIVDKNGKNSGLKSFYFPTVFLTKPSSIEKIKKVKLTDNSNEDDYRVLRYKQNDQVVVSVKVPQSINNVEEFYKLFTSGKLPTTIKYDNMHNYFTDSIALNGASYGVSLQLFGILISEMCRSQKDIKKPFRLSNSNDMTAYQTVNIREIPRYVDPYASITSENWDEAVVSSIINKDHKNSPMEKLLID